MDEESLMAVSVFDFSVENLQGERVKLSKFEDNIAVLIVNFSTSDEEIDKHFLELKEIKQKYCDDIAILLFPCCQFGEPMMEKENSEIYCWCKFDGIADFAEVFSMVNVKGSSISPLFKYLTEEKPPEISWNFNKFLVNKRGRIVKRFDRSSPYEDIVKAIKNIL